MSAAIETDDTVKKALQNLSKVYQTLVGNHLLNEELVRSPLPNQQWHEIEGLFYSRMDSTESQQLNLFSLYQGISALRRLANILLTHVRHRLTARIALARQRRTGDPNEIPLLELTAATIESNVKSLVDRLVDLFVAVNGIDELQNGTTDKVVKGFPELSHTDSWMLEALSKSNLQ